MTVNDRMRVERYGPTYHCGRIVYVALEGVEKLISDEQIEAASGRTGHPLRPASCGCSIGPSLKEAGRVLSQRGRLTLPI